MAWIDWHRSLNKRTAVYRLRDRDGRLLYVGMTCNPDGRLAKHRQKPWWIEVAEAEVEWHDTRLDAQIAERAAIFRENPVYNLARPASEAY